MKTNRLLLAMTFMSAFLFGTSLYAQQEVDPTWYNPWPVANDMSAHAAQLQAAEHKSQPKIVSDSPAQQLAQLHAKRVVSRPAQSTGDGHIVTISRRPQSLASTVPSSIPPAENVLTLINPPDQPKAVPASPMER